MGLEVTGFGVTGFEVTNSKGLPSFEADNCSGTTDRSDGPK